MYPTVLSIIMNLFQGFAAFGSITRAKLTGGMPEPGRFYAVELPRKRVEALRFSTDRCVRLRLAQSRLFSPSPTVDAAL